LLLLLSNPKTAETLLTMAIAVAKSRGYELEVLHVIVVPRHQFLAEAQVRTTLGQRLLRQSVRLGQKTQVPVHTQIRVAHDLAEAILDTIKTRHINLVIMGWKGSTTAPGRIFSRVVDTMIRQAACKVMLIKLGSHHQFDRWLVPVAGGPNVEQAIQLLPALTSLSQKPQVTLCQVFEPDPTKPNLTTLDRAARFLQQDLDGAVATVPIQSHGVAEAVLNYAQQDHTDVILLGASREGLLQQVTHGNIPAAISRSHDQTVILVRGT
jgi:CIC family chloride channel protein